MRRLLVPLSIGFLISSHAASAAERTVTLTVDNMYCEACPYIVKRTLERVPGVSKVTVSLREKTAVVAFDDGKVSVGDLTRAATQAGFPSALKN
jgi:mercuric ion binding protein